MVRWRVNSVFKERTMNHTLRTGWLLSLCLGLAALATPASAADLAGTWTLNFPDDPTTWTFTQLGGSFDATTGDLSGLQYDMSGVTFGPWYAGLLFLTRGDEGAPTIPIGALVGSVSGDEMTGVLASYVLGIVDIEGQRENPTTTQRGALRR
jgi:hypothetical protein